jgi:quercetin dioxygenase-like cupin family protein/tetratricopeptide (TPR) repeat protein
VTYFATYRTPAIGFDTIAGRNEGLRRIVLAAGQLGASEGGPLHLHHGEEILHILSGEVDVTVGSEIRRCVAGDVVIIPTDTPHRFTTITQTTMEVVAELDAGQIFPVLDADGTTRLVEVYRADMPWSRQPPPGFDWTSDEEMNQILGRPGRLGERERILDLFDQGYAYERVHDLGPARRLLTEALDAATAAGMPEVVRPGRTLLGIVAHKADRLDEARVHLDAALALALDAGDPTDEAYCRQELGFLLLDTGDPELALVEFHALLDLAPGAVIVNLAGNGLNGMGVALLQLGRAAQAVPFLLAALAIRAELEDLEQQHVDLVHLAAAALALGNPSVAAQIARFLNGNPDTAGGMYGHDRRTLQAVLDATAAVDADPVASFDEARRLIAEISAASHPFI